MVRKIGRARVYVPRIRGQTWGETWGETWGTRAFRGCKVRAVAAESRASGFFAPLRMTAVYLRLTKQEAQRRKVMALLERVGTLMRANVNDLIEKAEDPEKLAKQLVLDMENQLLQLKTQVAIAIADQHLLQKKQQEHVSAVAEWHRKAELAVEKGKDEMARAALERSLSHERLASGFAQQLEDQTAEAETLRAAFARLQQKLTETQSATEMLIAQRKRVKTVGRANAAASALGAGGKRTNVLGRLQSSIAADEATNVVTRTMIEGEGMRESLEDRFNAMEREDRVERLLEEMKGRQPRLEGSHP